MVVILFPVGYIVFLSMANGENVLSATISSIKHSVPNEVLIEGVTYRNGFYSNLWPLNITYTGDSYKVGENEFYRVKCEQFDWVHSKIGGTTAGMLYCKDVQWENARAYYADSKNFQYYCLVGNKHDVNNQVIVTLTDVEPSKFDELLNFANENDYNPFGSNKGIKTRRFPIFSRNVSEELTFYKASKDGIFESYQGSSFLVVDGKLFLVFKLDYGHEELEAVDVEDELGQYFIGIIVNKVL
jgi:hypothetical protein